MQLSSSCIQRYRLSAPTVHSQASLLRPVTQPVRLSVAYPSPSTRRDVAASSSTQDALKDLKQAIKQPYVDTTYQAAATYMKTIGFLNQAELSRVLDIAMNPNSLFMTGDGSRTRNASARPLDVDKDIRPVVDFLQGKGVSGGDTVKLISAHPPIISYPVSRLEEFWAYLASIGVPDVNAAVLGRPTLLGLDVNNNLRKIVDYLQSVDTPPETIVKYLMQSI